MMKRLSKSGFTLTEIVIVVILIGVFATFALPNYTNSVEKSRTTEGIQILSSLLEAQKAYQYEKGSYTTDLTKLEVTIPEPKNFDAPTLDTDTTKLASIKSKSGGAYTLSISVEGNISCTDGSSTGVCKRLGY